MSDEIVEILEGKTIVRINTLGSMFDQGCVEVWTSDNKMYRMNVSLLVPILKERRFELRKKIKHTYLHPFVRGKAR